MRELIDDKLDLIRADRTAHQLRTGRLLPDRAKEFGEERTEEEIRMAADAALAEFRDAPVRSFVMTIANRKARDDLRSGGQPAVA